MDDGVSCRVMNVGSCSDFMALQAVQMTTDVVAKPNTDALTLDDFGVKPYKMEEAGIQLLMRFKRVQHFGLVKGYH